MDSKARVLRSLAIGAWVLMMPPVPLGTSLPPVSQWVTLSKHKTTAECEKRRGEVRALADLTITAGANASAFQVAAALGQLRARCVENKKLDPPPAPQAEPPAPPQAAPGSPGFAQ